MLNPTVSQILIYLTDFSSFIKKFTGDVGVSSVHYDWLIIFFFGFAILVVASSLGRSRMLLALLSIYTAYFIESNFLYFDKLRELFKNLPDHWLRIGLFFVIYVIVFVILNRSSLRHRLTLAESSVFPIILIAVVEMGFLTTILISYFPTEWFNKIPPKLIPYFATKNAQFWWAVTPLISLLLNRRKKQLG